MELIRTTEINASPQAVWDVVSDIDNAASTIRGISKVEVLEPATGPSIVGLKWRETRAFMGKEAIEVMWVTEAIEPEYYRTRAENHGAIYHSRIALEPVPSGTRLSMSFRGEPVTFLSRVLWLLTGWMAKRSLVGVIDQDLADIKTAVERGNGAS